MKIKGYKIEPDRLYTLDEWADIKGAKARTLAQNRSKGIGEPYFKVGRAIYYRGSDIIVAIEAGYRGTGERPQQRQRIQHDLINWSPSCSFPDDEVTVLKLNT